MYENYKIRGPYLRPDGRLFMQVVSPKRSTISYPKYLVEMKLGRYLEPNETVHHKDGNPLNNEWSNLEILDRSVHAKQDSTKFTFENFICPICKSEFILEGIRLRKFYSNKRNRNKTKTGPFCSRKCAGKYGKKIQMGE